MKKEQENANPLLPKDMTVPDKQMITAKVLYVSVHPSSQVSVILILLVS